MVRHRLSRKIEFALERLLPTLRGSTLGIAVSGGPDSVALGAALVAAAPKRGLRLHVLHVNHGLRPEADEEQHLVESLCQHWQVPCTIERLVPPTKQSGIEAWAREARYFFFRRVREDNQLIAIALAHTRDDQAETVLFRFLRGSARRGLAGIPPIRDGWIIRPLLECTRKEVMQYLTMQALPFVTDTSNADLRYTRNRIRHELLPLLEREFSPRIRDHLVQMAAVFREEEAWLETLASTARSRAQESDSVLSLPRLAIEPAVLQTRILRQWIESHTAVREVTSYHLKHLQTLAAGRSRVTVDLPGGMSVRREGIHLVLEEKPYVPSHVPVMQPYSYIVLPGQEVDIPQGGWRVRVSDPSIWDGPAENARLGDLWQAVFDMDECDGHFLIRNFRPGDRITPLGLRGKKKVHDVFIDTKVPLMLRRVLPLIVIGDRIAWIPGCVRGEVAKISATTRCACRAEVIPLPEK
jgi:tRNA(Ile)-lysidine synthase